MSNAKICPACGYLVNGDKCPQCTYLVKEKKMPNKIDSFQGEHRFLSNFWPCVIQYGGRLWPSAENLYQALKCRDISDMRSFVDISPGAAKRLGRTIILRADWESVKLQIMCDVVRAKFMQNLDLQILLLKTNDAELIEGNTWHDTFWGRCNGIGQNNLGKNSNE